MAQKQAKACTDRLWEIARVLAGETVVANVRTDKELIDWAKRNGRYVYVGRPSQWGNPFRLTHDTQDERERVLLKYRIYLESSAELLADIPSLQGKVLGCWCHPQLCHGHVLAEYANGED